jgi:dihydropteridine reductase
MQIIVQGAAGFLGKTVINAVQKSFRECKIIRVSTDKVDGPLSSQTFPPNSNLKEQFSIIQSTFEGKVDAVLNFAGGYSCSSLESESFLEDSEKMVSSSLNSSFLAAKLAKTSLSDQGFLLLCGSAGALSNPTPWALHYGASKVAVHHLTRSLKSETFKTICLAPVTLDTAANRVAMPKADFSTWTPCEHIAEKIVEWMSHTEQIPPNGSILKVATTKDGLTSFNLV